MWQQFPLSCFSFHCNSVHFGFIVFFLQFADRFAKPAVLCPSLFPHRVRVMSQDDLRAPLVHHRSSLVSLLYFLRYEDINFPSLFSLQSFPYTLLHGHCLLNLRFLFSLIVCVPSKKYKYKLYKYIYQNEFLWVIDFVIYVSKLFVCVSVIKCMLSH